MCKKQTSVSHSSTEAEITSLDAGHSLGHLGFALFRNKRTIVMYHFMKHFTERLFKRRLHSKILDNRVNALIDVIHTPTTSAAMAIPIRKEGQCDFAGCDPFIPVNAFDNYSTATSIVDLGAAVPETSHRLPAFIIILLVHYKSRVRVKARLAFTEI